MAPCIPTYRPIFTGTRLAAAVAALAVASSVYMVFRAPPVMAAPSASAISVEQSCEHHAAT